MAMTSDTVPQQEIPVMLERLQPANNNLLIPDIGYSHRHLADDVHEALVFHENFLKTVKMNFERGLHDVPVPEWAPRLLRKKGVAAAVIEKAGSLTFTKRRPDDTAAFLRHVQACCDRQAPLLFRVAFGPLKNVNCCGGCQAPDLAEYLTVIQLARFMAAIAPLYPHGVKIQLVPDDLRARKANLCCETMTRTYITGLRHLVRSLAFGDWIEVEDGEARLYRHYRVPDYHQAAEARLQAWKESDPESYAMKWQSAVENADKNLSRSLPGDRADAVSAAARRYLAAHQAEILSGMWSPQDAFPLIFANHPNTYQIYSLGHKKSKLPWQICLPVSLLDRTSLKSALSVFFRGIM